MKKIGERELGYSGSPVVKAVAAPAIEGEISVFCQM